MAKDKVGCEIRKGDRVVPANGGVYCVEEVHPTDDIFSLVEYGASHPYFGIHFYVLARDSGGSKSENLDKIAEAILKLNNARPRNPTKEEIVACINEAVK